MDSLKKLARVSLLMYRGVVKNMRQKIHIRKLWFIGIVLSTAVFNQVYAIGGCLKSSSPSNCGF
jgi:hypothetical protein